MFLCSHCAAHYFKEACPVCQCVQYVDLNLRGGAWAADRGKWTFDMLEEVDRPKLRIVCGRK